MRYRNLITLSAVLLCIFGLFQSCVKDSLETVRTEINPDPQEVINSSFYGQVLNDAGQPVAGADVTIRTLEGMQVLQTNSNGYFQILRYNNIGASAYIKVEAEGYFDGYRRVSLVRNNYNFTRIQLLDKTFVGTISSADGGEVSTSTGMKLRLPSSAILRSNGQTYEGDVRVEMAWVDPTGTDLPDRMIGDLSGISLEGNTATLATYGMVHVELSDANGQELNIKEGQLAQLSYPIPSSRLTSAPNTIPLWSYDEVEGTWIEESFAILEGNNYVGDVSHFSAWNVDFLMDPITINGCVQINSQNREGTVLRARVLVCSDLIGTKGGWLCPDGKFEFYNFPKNEEFTLKILDECGEVIYEQVYGPFDADENLGTINVDLITTDLVSIIGTALNCDNQNITNGYAQITTDLGDEYLVPITDGVYSLDLPACLEVESATIVVFDYDALKMSAPVNVTLTPGINNIEVLEACDELDEFLYVIIPDVTNTLTLNPYLFGAPGDFGVNFRNDTFEIFSFGIGGFDPPVSGTGTYQVDSIWLNYYNIPEETGIWINTVGSPITVTITSYGPDVDDIVRGSYEGEVEVWQNQMSLGNKIINGTFKIRRDR